MQRWEHKLGNTMVGAQFSFVMTGNRLKGHGNTAMGDTSALTRWGAAHPRAADKVAIEKLAKQAMRGEREALAALCQAIAKGILFRVSCKMNNRMDAEDVAQEILIRVCSRIHELKDPKAFRGWLNSIIVNETNRYIKKGFSQADILNIDEYLDTFEEEDEEFLPDEYAIQEEDRRAVMELVKTLPERQLEAVMLHYYEGLNVTETAAAMGITKQSVSRQLALAREKIKNGIEEEVKKTGTLNALVCLPTGGLLTQVLNQEAAVLPSVPDAWITQAMGLKSHAVKTAVAATTAKALSSSILAVTLAVATATAVLAVLWVSGTFSGQNHILLPLYTVQEASGTVVFSGGDALYEYINPVRAVAETSSEYGAMIVRAWRITSEDGRTVLYSGEGGNIGDILVQMQSRNEDGEYLLLFSLEDAMGGTYTLSRSFIISSSSRFVTLTAMVVTPGFMVLSPRA